MQGALLIPPSHGGVNTFEAGSAASPYVLTARRSGQDWVVGAITDWTARELDLDLSFLPASEFTLAKGGGWAARITPK